MLMKSEAKIRNYNRVQQVRYIVRKYLPRRIVFNDMSVGISFGIYGINSMLSGVVREAHDLPQMTTVAAVLKIIAYTGVVKAVSNVC